jgi:Cytochrome P460
VAIGDGRYQDPITHNSRGTTRIIFGTTPSRQHKDNKEADHPVEFGPVFANDLAIQAISGKTKLFPTGSVLVREKLAKKGNTQPELLAVMIKREKGFNPDGGDWQFLITNAANTKVKLRQKTGECLNCHYSVRDTDFVHPLLWVANEQ